MASTSASNSRVKPESLPNQGGRGQDHPAIGQLHSRGANLQETFVLEEVEMSQPLDLGVMNRVDARDTFDLKSRPGDEIDRDRQHLLGSLELDAANVPRLGNPKRRFEELILHGPARLPEPQPAPIIASGRPALKDASRRVAVACGHP